ncbi:MAG: 2-oxoacid:ferredoxin oxidoreductase subunit gamma [Candidatus Abyssobacteria bacterium SURF_5]|uniref:2-oxoacid:ferredoxin oxidoreductase subunit gamma n=1 Tax=Abyssobacteria bacterium (strain SURF_5) TaxID=2093360 RepID=A0A3A4NW18_ABYX5|nr:MAG: 2-oxoacid:ferredoxin oxidoreductase subunit gamma [Candidatus Abyssubacteria bacterium SURF_5]
MSNRYYEVTFSGIGGKGVLTLGQILAEAGMQIYKHVAYFPNYSPAMRGGESESTVVFSDNVIPSPLIFNPLHAIVMDPASFTNFEMRLKTGGILVCDDSVISAKGERNDIEVFHVPASEKAIELGDLQVANMVLLGAYAGKVESVPIGMIERALTKRFAGTRRESLLELNKKAVREGNQLARKL